MRKRKDRCSDAKALVRRKTFDGYVWSPWETLLRRGEKERLELQLTEGGKLTVLPDLISKEIQQSVTDEVKESQFFRKYSIQGGFEPRTHFFLHDDATDNFDLEPQPGYRYGTTKMKSRPLMKLRHLSNLSETIKAEFGVEKWNVGVNPVLYRGSRDRIGFHADDDQGETLIVAAIVESPDISRCIEIRNKPVKIDAQSKRQKVYFPPGKRGEIIELFLGAGDVYAMDGVMQKEYVHCVHAAEVADRNTTDARLIVVFREGNLLRFDRDSGQPNRDLSCPSPIPIHFGHVKGIEEGVCYSRSQLLRTGAHRMAQRGISGNIKEGCDAIIVSGTRLEGQNNDCFETVVYAAEKRVGAGSLLHNFKSGSPIRIFRSSSLNNAYRAKPLESGKKSYRYDGLYQIKKLYCHHPSTRRSGLALTGTALNTCYAPAESTWFFALERARIGSDINDNHKPLKEFADLFCPAIVENGSKTVAWAPYSCDSNKTSVQPELRASAHDQQSKLGPSIEDKGPKCHRFRSLPRCRVSSLP